MNGYIKVNPEQLITMSSGFCEEANMIQQLTGQMMSLIHNTRVSWEGEAATAYINKFNGLQEDMDQMSRMIREHSSDLEDMARSYMRSEEQNESDAMALLNDVIH